MPLALDSNQTFEVVLATDQAKPRAARPAFMFRYPSNREWKHIAKVCDGMEDMKAAGVETLLSQMESALQMILCGWRNMSEPISGKAIRFAPGELDRLINPSEMSELLFCVLETAALTGVERKKSVSPSRSSSAKSAGRARGRRTARKARRR